MFGIEYFRMLSKKDIEVIVENGSPLVFRNGDNSIRRMRSFLNGSESNVSYLILKVIIFRAVIGASIDLPSAPICCR